MLILVQYLLLECFIPTLVLSIITGILVMCKRRRRNRNLYAGKTAPPNLQIREESNRGESVQQNVLNEDKTQIHPEEEEKNKSGKQADQKGLNGAGVGDEVNVEIDDNGSKNNQVKQEKKDGSEHNQVKEEKQKGVAVNKKVEETKKTSTNAKEVKEKKKRKTHSKDKHSGHNRKSSSKNKNRKHRARAGSKSDAGAKKKKTVSNDSKQKHAKSKEQQRKSKSADKGKEKEKKETTKSKETSKDKSKLAVAKVKKEDKKVEPTQTEVKTRSEKLKEKTQVTSAEKTAIKEASKNEAPSPANKKETKRNLFPTIFRRNQNKEEEKKSKPSLSTGSTSIRANKRKGDKDSISLISGEVDDRLKSDKEQFPGNRNSLQTIPVDSRLKTGMACPT